MGRLLCGWPFYLGVLMLWLWSGVADVQRVDLDLWGKLALGGVISQSGHFPTHDYFSYTAYGAPWIDHEWLAGWIFYQVLASVGEGGLIMLKGVVLGGILALLFYLYRRGYEASPRLLFYGVAVLAPFITFGFIPTVRSQVFTFLFFVVFVVVLELCRLGRWPRLALWGLVPLLWLWANCHGGFVLGILVCGLYGVGQVLSEKFWGGSLAASASPASWRKALGSGARYVWLCSAMLLGVLILNPYGWTYWGYILHALTLERETVLEWRAPFSFAGTPWWERLFLLGLPVWWVVHWRQYFGTAERLTPSLVLLLGMAMGLKAIRFKMFLPLLLLAYLPLFQGQGERISLPETWKTLWNRGRKLWEMGIPCVMAGYAGFTLWVGAQHLPLLRVVVPDEMTRLEFSTIHYPVGLVRFLQASPYHGNVLNAFPLGEFLFWELYPRFRVSVDGRYEAVYPEAHVEENHRFYQTVEMHYPQRTVQYADRSGADFIIIPTGSPNFKVLQGANSTWSLVYQDPTFSLLGRRQTLAEFEPYTRPSALFYTERMQTLSDFLAPLHRQHFAQYPPVKTVLGR